VGYIAFIDGSGWTVELDDNGAHLVKSIIKCEANCGDDRVFKDGTCFRCHELINRDQFKCNGCARKTEFIELECERHARWSFGLSMYGLRMRRALRI
jgi:hypothetical protein